MRRREMLLGMTAGVLSGSSSEKSLADKEIRFIDEYSHLATVDGRRIARKTESGLEPIAWEGIRVGDQIVLFDWDGGKMVGIMFCTVEAEPDMLDHSNCYPIQVRDISEVNCKIGRDADEKT